MPAMRIEPFSIQVPAAALRDLQERLRNTRWPPPAPGPAWAQGTDQAWLRGLVEYWADGFDWPRQERELNAFPHYLAHIDGLRIHFVHHRAVGGRGIPLILTHGWPSAFIEYLGLVPLLTDPGAHGLPGPGFDLVIPSLPGYGFSDRPAVAPYRAVARLWHQLMRGLGYPRYGAGGGDFGAGVATFMALEDPAAVIGLYLTTPELTPQIQETAAGLTGAEAGYLADVGRWAVTERGYSAIQSTRPQTLGCALNDSPAGLAAWILEKWRAWSDCGGDLAGRFGRDFLLTLLTLYWVTETITPSMRDYFDNRWHGTGLESGARVRVPTAFANFHRLFVPEGNPPREWFERLYDLRRWTVMARGGHFAAAEEPGLLASDLAAFFAEI